MGWHGRNAKDLLDKVYWQGGAALIVTVPPGMKAGDIRWADIMVLTNEGVESIRKGEKIVNDKVVIWYLVDYLLAKGLLQTAKWDKKYANSIITEHVEKYAAAIWAPGNHGFKSLVFGDNDPQGRRPFFHRDNLVKPETHSEHTWLMVRYSHTVKMFNLWEDGGEQFEGFASFDDYMQSSGAQNKIDEFYNQKQMSWKYQCIHKVHENGIFLPEPLSSIFKR